VFTGPWVGLVILAAAAWFLRGKLGTIRMADVMAALHRVSPLTTLLAALMTAFCYLLLSLYDVLAFRRATQAHPRGTMPTLQLRGAARSWRLLRSRILRAGISFCSFQSKTA
jgi:uncharacterized membrane protein YbhN (UPF0104 family)